MQQFAASYASTGSRDDALMSSMFNQPRRIDRSTRLQSGRVSRIDTISLVRPTTVTLRCRPRMSSHRPVRPRHNGPFSNQRTVHDRRLNQIWKDVSYRLQISTLELAGMRRSWGFELIDYSHLHPRQARRRHGRSSSAESLKSLFRPSSSAPTLTFSNSHPSSFPPHLQIHPLSDPGRSSQSQSPVTSRPKHSLKTRSPSYKRIFSRRLGPRHRLHR